MAMEVVAVRIPEEMRNKLIQMAVNDGETLSVFIRDLLEWTVNNGLPYVKVVDE